MEDKSNQGYTGTRGLRGRRGLSLPGGLAGICVASVLGALALGLVAAASPRLGVGEMVTLLLGAALLVVAAGSGALAASTEAASPARGRRRFRDHRPSAVEEEESS